MTRKQSDRDGENILEYADSRGVEIEVGTGDRSGVLKGVKVLGLVSKNGRRYPKLTLESARELYESSKVNVDHPPQGNAPRRYGDRIGILKGVEVKQDGLYADFFFNPKHALAEQLTWDAEHAPENVGFSHNVQAKTRRRNGETIVEEITQVHSVDLVADPATTRGLFESDTPNREEDEMSLSEVTLEQLKADRPDLVKALDAATEKRLQESEEAKAKDTEIKTLKEQVDRYQAKEKLAADKEAVEKLIKEAKLPDALVSDTFRQTLLEADAEKRPALIEDRQALAGKVKTDQKPTSRDQNISEGEGDKTGAKDAKDFNERIRE